MDEKLRIILIIISLIEWISMTSPAAYLQDNSVDSFFKSCNDLEIKNGSYPLSRDFAIEDPIAPEPPKINIVFLDII